MTKREKKLQQILWRECKAMLGLLLMKQNGMSKELASDRWDKYHSDLIEESKG